MTRSTMRGLLYRAATTALLTLLPSVAWAQVSTTGGTTTGQTTSTGGISPNLLIYRDHRDGEEVEHGNIVYANLKDCTENAVFTFKTTYSASVPVVEAWLGVDTDCSMLSNRVSQGTATTLPKCQKLAKDSGVINLKMPIKGVAMFDNTRTGGDDEALSCDAVKRGAPLYTIYILPLSQETVINNGSEVVRGVNVLKASFTPYLTEPDRPINLQPLPGENRLGVQFEPGGDTNQLWKYKAWFDLAQGSGTAECGSGRLDTPTYKPSTGEEGMRVSGASSNKSAYIDNVGSVPFETSVRAVAVAIDPAGNESQLSDGVCVKRVETTSFLDACNNDPECQGSLDSCSLSPGRHASVFGLSFFVLALGALLSRRRSR